MVNTMVINKRKQKWIMAAALVVSLALIVLFFLGGGNLQLLKDLISSDVSTDEMRDHLMELGYRGYISTEYFDDIGGDPNDMEDVKLNSRYKVGMWMVAENVLTGTGYAFDHTLESKLQKLRPSDTPWVYDVPAEIWDDRKSYQ